MRMWMVDPRILCTKHLLGEHVEIHMFVGHINAGKRLGRYIDNNCVEPKSLVSRHRELANEMRRRGMNHDSDLEDIIEPVSSVDNEAIIDREISLYELLARCKECSENYNKMNGVKI